MTAASPEPTDSKAAPPKKAAAPDAVDNKVATNQIADPHKLMADSLTKPLAADSASTTPSSTAAKSSPEPLISLKLQTPAAANNPFLTFDNSIYDTGNSCKVTPYSADLFQLSDPNSVFSGKYDLKGFQTPALSDSYLGNQDFRPGGGPHWGAARRELINKVADHTFDVVFDEPGEKDKSKKIDALASYADSAAILKGHKPGDDWAGENGSRYRALPDGGLLRKDANGDVEYHGKDGKSFTRHGKDETWTLNGQTIEKRYGADGKETYLKRFSDGTTSQIVEEKDIKAIHQLENLTVTQHRTRLQESRQSFDAASNGVNQHTDGQDYVKDNGQGDRLRKDSQHDYALLKTKDGKFYAIKNGHVYQFDMDNHRFSPDELKGDKIPPALKRNNDGSFQFGTANLSATNELKDDINGLDFKNRAGHIHARCHGQDVDLSVDNGNERMKVGERVTTYDSSHDKLAVTDHGKPDMTFDYQSRTLQSEGITFTPDSTQVDGLFNLNESSGDIDFADGSSSWLSAARASDDEDAYGYSEHGAGPSAELHASINEALALSSQISTPGGQDGAIAQLRAILGKIDGITGGIEIQAAKAAAKGTVGGEIDKAQAISAINAKLFAAGQGNAAIAEAIAMRGPGTTDEAIVQKMLHKDA